jgi:hypothetical protein
LVLSVIAVAAVFSQNNAMAGIIVDLGSATSFAVLAGSGITFAGAVNTTTINGDIGTYPTPSITGLGNVVLNGVNHAGDGVTQGAKTDLHTAYLDAAGRTPTTTYGPIFDLGGLTLTPGVYNDSSSFGITGNLTLDAAGDPSAVWIFQAGSSLTTASSSRVYLINGALACRVFWQVGSSATIGSYSDFVGTILADTSITVGSYATVDGRVLAENGAVTFEGYNTVTASLCDNVVIPEPSYFWALTVCASVFGAWQWLVVRRRKAGRS